ncbi:MAG: hypothetical protein ACE363_06950 [Alphaproteobacteria bacterium]
MKAIAWLVFVFFVASASTATAQGDYQPGEAWDPDAAYAQEGYEPPGVPEAETEPPGLLPPPPGRSAFYYLLLDAETKANRPDLTVESIINESLNDFLVINYFNEDAQYSNYQRAVLRRTVAHLANRLIGRDAKLLDVMAFAADETPVYTETVRAAWQQNVLGGYATAVEADIVLPYGQVFIHGQLVYDFAVTLNAQNARMVAVNARAIQSSLQRIVGDLNNTKPLYEEPEN